MANDMFTYGKRGNLWRYHKQLIYERENSFGRFFNMMKRIDTAAGSRFDQKENELNGGRNTSAEANEERRW